MDTKTETKMIVIISTISIIVVTMTSAEQMANAAASTTTNSNTIDCQSKKGTASTTIFGTLGYAGGTCTGENGGTAAAGGIISKPVTPTTTTIKSTTANSNTINCQSKKGSANTAPFGTLKYAGGTCTGKNGGTAAAGGVKSNSGAVGIHGIQGPNGSSHAGGIRK